MTGLVQPFKHMAREATDAARAALRRALLIALATLIAALGLGFLLAATFVGLQVRLGAGLAALTIGAALLAVALAVILFATRSENGAAPAIPPDLGKEHSANPPTHAGDPATTAVFVAAFLLGRQLADRWDKSQNS